MNKAQMVALLGRPLTPIEDTNYDLYLDIATQSLEQLTCLILSEISGDEEPRVYDVREGYSTVFTDIFTDIDEVKLDGDVVASDNYSVRQWDKRSGSWYNSIVFEDRMTSSNKEVEVSATWGFDTMPTDLQAVLAGLFAQITKKNKYDPTITQKQVEDFRIHLNSSVDLGTEFYKTYGLTLRKYSLCDIPNVQHGKTNRWKKY